MNRWGGLAPLVVAAALAGCSSSGAAAPDRAAVASSAPSAAVTYATTADAVTAACAAFDKFSVDLNRLTPRGSQMRLVPEAQAVQLPLLHTRGVLDDSARTMLDDVDTFVGHIGSSTWPEHGTPVDPEISAVAADCAGQ